MFVVELPNIQDSCLHLGNMRFYGYGSIKLVDFVNAFALYYLVGLELEGIIVARFIPAHHGVVIGLSSHMLIRPFSLFCFINGDVFYQFPFFRVNYL